MVGGHINHLEIIHSLESRATENSSLSNSSLVLDNIQEDTLAVMREDPSVKCGEGDLTWDFLERPDLHGTYQIPTISLLDTLQRIVLRSEM